MFVELFDSKIFKADSLKTLISDVLYIDLNSSKEAIQNAIQKASPENEDYDNIVIKRDGKSVGFIPREELKNFNGNLNNLKYKKTKMYMFNASDTLDILIKRIKDDYKQDRSINLYFITNENAETGIITYADLNRRSVYIYNYIIYLFVEQWLRKQISDVFRIEGRKIDKNWMKYLEKSQKEKLIKNAIDKKESTISVCNFDDLLLVFKKDPKFETLRSSMKEELSLKTLESLRSMRPKIAHPTKLLVRKDKIQDSLRELTCVSELTKGFIPKEDSNEKNLGWPARP